MRNLRDFLYIWRFYSFGRENYQECLNNIFHTNLFSLRKASKILALLSGIFSLFPLIVEQSIFKMIIYLIVAGIGLFLAFLSNYLMQQINVKNHTIYMLIIIYYVTVILFAAFLDFWSYPGSSATIFTSLLIVALLLFIIPPQLFLFLTLGAMLVFIISAILIKNQEIAPYYILITLAAGCLNMYFNWQISKLRLGLEISTTTLEDERNKYEDQSITDELTQLRNRRDFNQTFQRYLSNYRSSDDWLCIAIADIDFFKFYNDHYGHQQGDECLRGIGRALTSLGSLGVYAARVGGEEFALLWFEKDSSHVDKVITVWTNSIRDLKIPHEKSKVSEYVTMSIGIYIIKCGTHHDTSVLYDLADKALYTAKSSGRNCTIVAGDEIKQYRITHSQTA